MTLYELIKVFKDISLKQPNVRSFGEGNIYNYMNATPNIKYNVVFITQGIHTEEETTDNYSLTMFYISRLQSDLEDNRLQIQSAGKEVLSNIIRTFTDLYEIELSTISYTTWTEQFSDECAGVYAQFVVELPKDLLCAEEY